MLATLLGTIMGLLRVSRGLFARLVAGSYVETIRNLPPLVLVFIVYFFIGERIMTLIGLEELIRAASPETQEVLAFLFAPPARLSGFFAGLATLILYEAAYITEIVRAGIQSVEKGQWEAAHALGLSPVAAGALRHPAAGPPADPAGPGRPAHLDDQGLRHRLGHLHPGAHLPGAGADERHLSHLRGLDHDHGALFRSDLRLLAGGQAPGKGLAAMNGIGAPRRAAGWTNEPVKRKGENVMKEKAKAMVLASFAGDSLALGAHWIYDTERIAREFGRVESLLAPKPDSYHPTKRKGQFTHYGDQAFVLLQSLAARKTFDLADFAERWRKLFAAYTGYYDKATKGTLQNFAVGLGPEASASFSNDLAGAARIAPLVYLLRDDPETLAAAARTQTAMTHGDPLTIDAAEFFARAACGYSGGKPPRRPSPPWRRSASPERRSPAW